uniref:Uncharacterized protein n=1 Tax=Candidatus Kentrum sp. FM TaxID=2126340 RepID=A0A450TGS8_9GAMM|nr:MAG: hypothetical protein BECKFM1743C_GA0114222_104231 [Candidatus Kentron sp. FM]
MYLKPLFGFKARGRRMSHVTAVQRTQGCSVLPGSAGLQAGIGRFFRETPNLTA